MQLFGPAKVIELSGSGVRNISASELGSRFDLVVDAKTGEPVMPNKAAIVLPPAERM